MAFFDQWRQSRQRRDFAPREQDPGTLAQPMGQPQGGGGNLEQAIAEYQQSNPYTPQAYEGLFDYLKQRGYNVTRPTRGGGAMSDDKIVGPDGRVYDLIRGVDAPGASWVPPSAIPGEYWFNGKREFRPWEAQGGGENPYGLPPGYSIDPHPSGLAGFDAPGLNRPFTKPFVAPTGTDDPGFKFAMEQAQKAIERSAASKGTLLTGGTLKDLNAHMTGMALQGYGDAWNRANALWQQEEGIWGRNAARAQGNLSSFANMGLNAANSSANLGMNYAGNAGDLMTGAANSRAGAQAGSGAVWGGALRDLGGLGAFGYQAWRDAQQNKKNAFWDTYNRGGGFQY